MAQIVRNTFLHGKKVKENNDSRVKKTLMKQAQDKLPSKTVRASTRIGSAFHYSPK
ncbi:MAG: hypothetical protein WD097_04570 [Balneolales bacterium]